MHETGTDPAETTDEAPTSVLADPAAVRTGVPAVDEVLAAVEALDDDNVETHAAVYEQAHDALRRALDAPGDA